MKYLILLFCVMLFSGCHDHDDCNYPNQGTVIAQSTNDKSVVPEPASIALLGAGLVLMRLKRQ